MMQPERSLPPADAMRQVRTPKTMVQKRDAEDPMVSPIPLSHGAAAQITEIMKPSDYKTERFDRRQPLRLDCWRTVAIMLMLFVAAACSDKEDLDFPKVKNLITFSNPYTEAVTKAAVPGEIENPYPSAEKFIVYAHLEKGDFTSWEAADGELYMDGVEVSHKDNPTAPYSGGSWQSETNYSWPNEGKLTFAAYSPADSKNHCSSVMYDKTGLTLTDFTISTNGYTKAQAAAGTPADGVQYDLMYADRVKNKIKSIGTGPDYNGVDIVFKHILSSIRFKVKTDLRWSVLGCTINLSRISILNVCNKGTFKENIPAGEELVGTADWTINTSKVDYVFFESAGTDISDETTAKDVMELDGGVGCILLPQTFTAASSPINESNDANIVKVEWTTQWGSTMTPTKSMLFDLHKITPDGWVKSKRYAYTLTISPFNAALTADVLPWNNYNSNTNIDF